MQSNNKIVSFFKNPPQRLWIPFMCFCATCILTSMRINISINIIAMVRKRRRLFHQSECMSTAEREYTNKTEAKIYKEVNFAWNENMQSYIIGAYFYGFFATNLIGGLLAEIYGPRIIITTTFMSQAVLSILTPFICTWHWSLFFVTRVIIGLLGGCCYPSLHTLVANWAPPHERGRFLASFMMGSSLATFTSWPILSIIIYKMNWMWAFYLPSFGVLLWSVIWLHYVHDSPHDHPTISEEEKQYILESQKETVARTKGVAPFKEILKSSPVCAYIVLSFSTSWVINLTLMSGPSYLRYIHGLSIHRLSWLGAIPYIAQANILPSLCVFLIGYAECNTVMVLVLFTFCTALNGACTVVDYQIPHDLAPNYAGTVTGISDTFCSLSGILVPTITSNIMTSYGHNLESWKWLFLLSAFIYLFGGTFFLGFGQSEEQVWNRPNYRNEKRNSQQLQKRLSIFY